MILEHRNVVSGEDNWPKIYRANNRRSEFVGRNSDWYLMLYTESRIAVRT
jgi:hypothetical protein